MVASAHLRLVPNKMGKIRSRPDYLSELKKKKKKDMGPNFLNL